MFDKEKLTYAVGLQSKAYELLLWVASALDKGFVSFSTMHTYASMNEAAQEWIERHYENMPQKAKPQEEDIPAFSGMFSTFLQNSFDLVEKPGKNMFSPGAHCFCPMCSWLINASHLKTKKLQPQDKKRASKMMRNELAQKALENAITLDEKAIEKLLGDKSLVTSMALCAYGTELIRRLNGVATGPAVLELWRRFAWTADGSPRKKFQLSSEMIMDAERLLVNKLFEVAKN